MSKPRIWIIALVVMILLMKFPLPILSQEIPTIKADPSEINVPVNRNSDEQTTVTLVSTFSIEKTVVFQNDTSNTYPTVDLYNESMTVPANSKSSQGASVNPGAIPVGSYDVSLTFYFQDDVKRNTVGAVIFHILVYDRRMDNFPLKAEPKNLNLSVPAGMSTVKEIKLTNIAHAHIEGELIAENLLCEDTPYIQIIGDPSIVLEKNESIKIKVRIDGALTSSSTCYDLGISFKINNMSSTEERDVVVFHVRTSPGPGILMGIFETPFCAIPFAVVLIIVVVLIVLIVRNRMKKRKQRPQANTISRPGT